MKLRADRGRVILLAVAIGSGLQCDQIDEDPHPVLAHLAGPGATACGVATSASQAATTGEVRACMVEALGAHRSFTAAAAPGGADGAITIGWASDGKLFWRVEYQVVEGCSPVWYDSLEQDPCERIRDLGATCDSLAEDLCFACDSR